MTKNIEQISISLIKANDLNKRSMDPLEIEILAQSIKHIGLISPLTVYADPKSDAYIIVSGHKRLEALKLLGEKTCECTIVESPSNNIKEKELMLQANMHRGEKEDVLNEVSLARANWESMPETMQKDYSEELKTHYRNRTGDESAKEFRPMLEYILCMTGLTRSYRSIQNYMYEVEASKEEDEAASAEKKEPKPKKRKVKDPKTTTKAMIATVEFMLCSEYEYEVDADSARKLQHCLDVLKEINFD